MMFNKIWQKMSIDRKVRCFALIVVAIILLSSFLSLFVMGFSLKDYGKILNENKICQEFMDAMESEGNAFHVYISERTETSRQTLSDAMYRTEKSVYNLPFDYELIGPERYARTWNILNAYECYKECRDTILDARLDKTGYLPKLNEYNKREQYLEQYSRKLLQLTVEAGSDAYTRKLPTFRLLPFLLGNFILVMLFIVFSVSQTMSESIVTPVLKLSKEAKRIGQSDFSGDDIEVDNRDEIGDLVRIFNGMKHATSDYIHTMQENHRMTELLQQEKMEHIAMEKRLETNRLELLKSQINPHFLFNTLNMIGSMAELEEAETTVKMTHSLAQLFRYNLSTKEQIVPIESELTIAENYMYLQKMRFGSRVKYEVHVPEDIGDIKIPSFTMQPLVENAIVHGISRKEEGGTVSVDVRRKDDGSIEITISDDGMGIKREVLDRLLERLNSKDENRTSGTGIGLGNIFRRIKTLYQGGGDLEIVSEEGNGTSVILTIPQLGG